ncbi:ANK [Seminavis robusta]|uniref:ANK n=1 Tax=Seminavis robusta TaxID=568900 RepID=A0A9N8HRS6_9STRA|nr:ANK [Seminavis robusta]|eukprot:Sro1614_g286120.1 ANK (225) ;mRNA; r:18102-18776
MNKRRLADEESNRETTRATKKRLVTNTHDGSPRKVQVIRISSSLPDRMLYHGVKTDVSPEMKIEQILLASNLDVDWTSYTETDFFLPPTQDEIEAYDFDILNAVRAQDMATLRRFRKDGRPLKCSNKFGESILHLACRKGFVEVTRFLVQEAGVPLAVCDDYGRSPLHDACWRRHDGRTFELIDIILQKCPDLFTSILRSTRRLGKMERISSSEESIRIDSEAF